MLKSILFLQVLNMAIAFAALTLAVGYETYVREIQKSISSVNIDMKNSIFGKKSILSSNS